MGKKTRGSTAFRSSHNQLIVKKALDKYHEEQKKIRQEALERKLKNRRKPIMLTVQIQSGRSIIISVSLDDSLDDIREKIRMKEGINPDQQVLMLNGTKLIDGTVEELGISETSILYLTLRNRGG